MEKWKSGKVEKVKKWKSAKVKTGKGGIGPEEEEEGAEESVHGQRRGSPRVGLQGLRVPPLKRIKG